MLENVKQLKGHDKGRTLKVILEHLDALNYYVNYEVLRAGDFGVPQNRERIYIVGLNKEYYNISDDYEFKFPTPTYEKTRLGDILEHDVDEKYTISDALWEGHQRRKKEHKKKEMDLVIHYLTKNQNIQILLVHDIIRMEAKF